jgi:hypothetical protein
MSYTAFQRCLVQDTGTTNAKPKKPRTPKKAKKPKNFKSIEKRIEHF